MTNALRTDPKTLSDRKLWELLHARTACHTMTDAARRELLARGQLLPDRVFHAPR